jgi:peptidyl-prolyl cis-trans isomerase C
MNHTLNALALALALGLAFPASAEEPAAAAPTPAAAAPAASAPGFTGKVAKVNGVTIPPALGNAFMKEQIAQGAIDGPDLRSRIRDHLVRREVLLQVARKEKVDKDPELLSRMAYARDEMLINAYLDVWTKQHPVTDADITAEYDRAAAKLGTGTEYKASHILVEKEEDAKSIITNLQNGMDFATLAIYSKDAGTKERGGDLGWADAVTYVKEFSAAMTALEKGKYTTEPVKTEYGYHVILLEDVRKKGPPPLNEVKERMVQHLQQQAVQKHVETLLGKAKVE